jgi:hypothetical protein
LRRDFDILLFGTAPMARILSDQANIRNTLVDNNRYPRALQLSFFAYCQRLTKKKRQKGRNLFIIAGGR